MVQEFQLDSRYAGYTVSEGTLKTEDLVNAFEDFIRLNVDPKSITQDLVFIYEEFHVPTKWYETEQAEFYLNEDLFPFLESIAPEGCYFGTLEGDGACFGFWPLGEE